MKVLLTGAAGQLGRELQRTVPDGIRLLCYDREGLEITDRRAVARCLASCRPDLVINAAAYTAVDRAEDERQRAWAVNATAVGYLAAEAGRHGSRLFQLSTDFVFDGEQSRPYAPEDHGCPVNVYGQSKLAGEQEALRVGGGKTLIVRTSWLYAARGHNFVNTMLRLLREKESLTVVADQVGGPTWARGLAEMLWRAAARPDLGGIYHYSDAGVAGWYDLALAVQEEGLRLGLLRREVPVRPIAAAEYPVTARRPHYSVLDCRRTWRELALNPRHWRVSLRLMLEELQNHA